MRPGHPAADRWGRRPSLRRLGFAPRKDTRAVGPVPRAGFAVTLGAGRVVAVLGLAGLLLVGPGEPGPGAGGGSGAGGGLGLADRIGPSPAAAQGLGHGLLAGEAAEADIATPAPMPPGGRPRSFDGAIRLGAAPVREAVRLIQARADLTTPAGPQRLDLRLAATLSVTHPGDSPGDGPGDGTTVVRLVAEDIQMDAPGLPPLPRAAMRHSVAGLAVTAFAAADGSVTVDRPRPRPGLGALDPIGVATLGREGLAGYARLLAKATLSGRSIRMGETVFRLEAADLGQAGMARGGASAGPAPGIDLAARVTGLAEGAGHRFVVVEGEGPVTLAGGPGGSLTFVVYIDQATGLPMWSRSALTLDTPTTAALTLIQTDEVVILDQGLADGR